MISKNAILRDHLVHSTYQDILQWGQNICEVSYVFHLTSIFISSELNPGKFPLNYHYRYYRNTRFLPGLPSALIAHYKALTVAPLIYRVSHSKE